MRRSTSFLLAIVALSSSWATAMEVTTGFLIGPKYDSHAFYVRPSPTSPWQKTYSGPEYRRAVQGKLMGVRLSQALYQDDFAAAPGFDAPKNTDAAIACLDTLKSFGVLLVSVDLQGTDPGYSGGRRDGFQHGPEKGSAVSAYRADGTLRPEWMERLSRLLKAADSRGMVVKVILFYQRQDEMFDSSDAMLAAARNITDWLIQGGHRNVILNIASDWSNAEWNHDSFVALHLEQLIDAIRDRFQALKTDFALPVAVSAGVRLAETSRLIESADLLVVRRDGLQIDPKKVPRPEIVTSLDRGDENGETLAHEITEALAGVDRFSGWLSRPVSVSHRFPFQYEPAGSAWRADLDEQQKPAAYLRSLLDAVAQLTLTRPPKSKPAGVK